MSERVVCVAVHAGLGAGGASRCRGGSTAACRGEGARPMFCRSALCHARGRWKPLQLSHGCPCPALPALPCALVPRPPGAAFQLIDCTQAVRAAGAGQGRKHALPAPGLAGGAAGGVQRPPPSHPQGPLDVLLLTAFPPTTAPGGGGAGDHRKGPSAAAAAAAVGGGGGLCRATMRFLHLARCAQAPTGCAACG